VRSDREGDRRLRLANSSPDVKALFNSPSYIYDLEEQEDSPSSMTPGGSSLDYWTPLPPIGSGIPSRTRNSEDALKRGSDSLLETKMKEHISKAPRSLQNRAQSLDLTSSLSRITETASRLPPPESPTNSTGDGGSPTSVTAPSFPSVYSPRTGSSAQRAGRVLDDDAVNEVSRVISNLGL